VSQLPVTATNDMSSMKTRRTAHGGLTDLGLAFPVSWDSTSMKPSKTCITLALVKLIVSHSVNAFYSKPVWSRPHHYVYFSSLWRYSPSLVMVSSFLMFLDHNQRHATIGRTPLGAW